jgi:COP9 signalosome complex subunit 5
MAAGKVEIGAFRTYPPNYKPPDAVASEYQSIPLDKIEVLAVIFVGEISSRWC